MTTFNKLQELSKNVDFEIEHNGEEFPLRAYTYREGRDFIDASQGETLDNVILNAAIDSFVEDSGERLADSQTYNTISALIEGLPGGFVVLAGEQMLIKSFGENWKDNFPQELGSPITQEDIEKGAELASEIAAA